MRIIRAPKLQVPYLKIKSPTAAFNCNLIPYSTTTNSTAGFLTTGYKFYPLHFPHGIRIAELQLNVVTAQAGSSLKVGLYEGYAADNLPGTLLFSTILNTASTGLKSLPCDFIPKVDRIYWYCGIISVANVSITSSGSFAEANKMTGTTGVPSIGRTNFSLSGQLFSNNLPATVTLNPLTSDNLAYPLIGYVEPL
jgi:hypothetical protein